MNKSMAWADDAMAALERLDADPVIIEKRRRNEKLVAHWTLCIPGGVDLWVCPKCSASVIAMFRHSHDNWHAAQS